MNASDHHCQESRSQESASTTGELEAPVGSKEVAESRTIGVASETLVPASSVASNTTEEEQASGGELVAVVQGENVPQEGHFDSVSQRQRQEEEYNSILHSLEDLGLDASDFDPSPLLSSTDGSGSTSTNTDKEHSTELEAKRTNTTTSNNDPTNHYSLFGDSDSSSFYLNEGEEEVLRSVLEGLILGDDDNDDADGNILGQQTNQEEEGTRNTTTVCPPSAASYEQEEHFPSTVPGDDNNDFPLVNGTTSNSRVFGVLSSFKESTLEQPFEDDIYNPNDLFPDIITTTDEVVPLIGNEGEEQQVTQQHPTTTTSEVSNQPFADSNALPPFFDNLEELLLLQQLGDLSLGGSISNDADDDINSWDADGDSDIEQEDTHKIHNDHSNTNAETIGEENDILSNLLSKEEEDEDFFVTSDIFDDIDNLLNHTTNITSSNDSPSDNIDKVADNTPTNEKEEESNNDDNDDDKSENNENKSTNTSSSKDSSSRSSHKDSAQQRQHPHSAPLSYTNVFSDDEDDSSTDENDTRNNSSIQHPPPQPPRGKPASFLLTHFNKTTTKQQADEETEVSERIKDTSKDNGNDNSEIDPSQEEDEEEHHLYKTPLSDIEERRLTHSLLSQLRLPKDSDDDDENDETHSKKKDEAIGPPPLTLDLDHHSLDVYDRHHLEVSNEQRSPKEEKTSTTTAEEAALLAAKKHTVIRQRQKLSRSHQSKHQLPMIDEDQEQTIDIKVDSSCKMPHRDPDVVQAEAEHAAQPFLDAFGISAATIISDNTNTTTTTSNSSTKPQSFKKKTNPAERICYGHKETVFGASFSPCGRLLATASQDSTIIVWNVTTHSILTTLRGHSRDYECLRVAWAPVATTTSRNSDVTTCSSPQPAYWGQHVLPPLPDDVAAILESSSTEDGTATTTTKCNVLMLASSSANGVVKLWRLILLEEEDATATSSNTKLKLACVPECVATFDHSLQNGYGDKIPGLSEDELPQIYSLQFIQEWMNLQHDGVSRQLDELLLSSADDEIHLWELTKCPSETSEATVRFNIVLIMQFVNLDQGLGGVKMRLPGEKDKQNDMTHSPSPQDDETAVFGGTARNPKRKVFVFDATHCSANHLLAVALADGTARIVNGRGICVSILELPGSASHLTAVSWDNTTGSRLATSAATGHVILWKLEQELVTMMIDDKEQHAQEGREVVVAPQQIPSGKDEDNMNGDNNKSTKLIPTGRYFPSCTAVLQGGHVPGRPLFGTCFCSGSNEYDKQELLLSWGVDGKLCLWNSNVEGYGTPIAVLKSSDDYPIYTVDVTKFKGFPPDSTRTDPNNESNCSTDTNSEATTAATKRHLVVGGGTDGGFIGIPVYIYEI